MLAIGSEAGSNVTQICREEQGWGVGFWGLEPSWPCLGSMPASARTPEESL